MRKSHLARQLSWEGEEEGEEEEEKGKKNYSHFDEIYCNAVHRTQTWEAGIHCKKSAFLFIKVEGKKEWAQFLRLGAHGQVQ